MVLRRARVWFCVERACERVCVLAIAWPVAHPTGRLLVSGLACLPGLAGAGAGGLVGLLAGRGRPRPRSSPVRRNRRMQPSQ